MGKPLYSPAAVAALLAEHGLKPDKAFGQNFLVDGNVLTNIVDAAALTAEDTVLEIGPGLGVLTQALARRAGKVVSVELDTRLLPILDQTVGGLANVTVVAGDGLTFDLNSLPLASLLVANLPYNVGTPVLLRALESGRFKRLVVMLQREVAERLSAGPGDSAYGALSLIAAAYGRVERVGTVNPGAFLPAPEVVSAVVRIDVDGDGPGPQLTTLIHTAFRHRRKTLKKNLLMAGFAKDRVGTALEGLGLEPKVRAEALPLDVFIRLQQELENSDIR